MAHVFIIDDDPLFAKLVTRALCSAGFEVDWNDGAYGALTRVRNGDYSVILIDVQMPDIEGTQIVGLLRSRGGGNARIILMSSIPESDLMERARRANADGYFQKSGDLTRLAFMVGRFCGASALSGESLDMARSRS